MARSAWRGVERDVRCPAHSILRSRDARHAVPTGTVAWARLYSSPPPRHAMRGASARPRRRLRRRRSDPGRRATPIALSPRACGCVAQFGVRERQPYTEDVVRALRPPASISPPHGASWPTILALRRLTTSCARRLPTCCRGSSAPMRWGLRSIVGAAEPLPPRDSLVPTPRAVFACGAEASDTVREAALKR